MSEKLKEDSVDFQMRYGLQIIRVEIKNIRILTNEWGTVVVFRLYFVYYN